MKPHVSHAEHMCVGMAEEVHEAVKSLAGTRWQVYEFGSGNGPFILHGKSFEPEPEEIKRPFFSETIVHRSGDASVRIRAVRYPDMDTSGVHSSVLFVYITYFDGYMIHSKEGLFRAESLRFIFDIDLGERYLGSIAQ